MWIRFLYACMLATMVIVAASASFGEQAQRFKPSALIITSNYLLADSDMPGYQLSAQNMQTWRMPPKDGVRRAVLGVHQAWTSPQSRNLTVRYGSFQLPEEASAAAALFMSDSKQPFREGAFPWQKEEDRSWIALLEGKETIVFVREKVALSAEAVVDTEEDRTELEASVLKVLGKIENALKQSK